MKLSLIIIFLFISVCPVSGLSDQNGVTVLRINGNAVKQNDVVELVEEISDTRIVYIGEVHNISRHHEVQLEIIKRLYKENPKIAIGMEMFQKDFQKVIDSYLSGRIDEKEFLEKTEYETRWGFDYGLYKPIIEFAKKNRIPVVALSINSDIIKEISNKGLTGSSSRVLSGLPNGIDFTNTEYEDYLMEFYNTHPKTEKSDFRKFYSIQVIWDEAMAANIDRFLLENKDYTMVVLAGNGHIVYGHGIPSRAYRRNRVGYKTILNDTGHSKGISDYVIYSSGKKFH